MILVDVDILVYASNGESDQHVAARDWLDGQLNGSAPIGLLACLRVATS